MLLAFVASAARSIRATSTRTSRTAASPTTGAARRAPPTHLLDPLHYDGLLRVARREAGHPDLRRRTSTAGSAGGSRSTVAARIDALVDVVVRKYAPLPRPEPVGRRRAACATPRRNGGRELKPALLRAKAARARARRRRRLVLAGGRGVRAGPSSTTRVRLLAPFDPVVWDRRRFELFWGWAYRFEAYTPVAKRKLGYYALPLLWRDRVDRLGQRLDAAAASWMPHCGYVRSRRRATAVPGARSTPNSSGCACS